MGSLFDDWGSVSTSYKSESLSGSTDATFAVEGLLCRAVRPPLNKPSEVYSWAQEAGRSVF